MSAKKRLYGVAAAAAVAALLAAGCGSSDEHGGGGNAAATEKGASASGGTTRGITDDSIKVGALLSQQVFGPAVEGAKARFARENAAGGVFGRKIDLTAVGDDKFDPTTNIQVSRQLATQDKVFAIVPSVTVVLGSGPYLAEQKVPMFGWGISAQFCQSQWAFGITGCVVSTPNPEYANPALLTGAAKALGKDPKGLTVAILGDDNAEAPLRSVAFTGTKLGMKVVYAKAVVPAPPATVGDFTPFVQDILASNGGQAPDIVVGLQASVELALGLQRGLQDAGYHGLIVNTTTYDPKLAAPSKGSSVFVQFGAFETADKVPGVKQMLDDLQAAGVAPGVLSATGWLSADMFIAALKKAGKDLTVERFYEVANKLTYQIKDTIGPTKFPLNHLAPGTCGTVVTANGTGYDVSAPYYCAPIFKYQAG